MSNPVYLPGPEDHRQKFDLAEYERQENEKRKQKQRDEEEKPKKKVKKEPLQARESKLDLDSRVGKSVIITKSTPLNQAGGFYCEACDCVIKDSINYLDHINGRKHQRNLGHSMKLKRSTLDDVKAKLQAAKEKNEEELEEYDLEERLKEMKEEEERLKEYRREKKQEKKKRQKSVEPPQDDLGDMDPDMAQMMGFGGFGSSKK